MAWACIGALVLTARGQQAGLLENHRYQIRVNGKGALDVTDKATSLTTRFSPEFLVLFRPDDPGLQLQRIRSIAFVVPAWKRADGGGKTSDYFQAAEKKRLTAMRTEVKDSQVDWQFKGNSLFDLTAEVTLPGGDGDPVVSFRLHAHKKGWYSVGYAGAPAVSREKADGIFQPLVWQEKRFPDSAYLSAELMCTIPSALVYAHGGTIGVAADPSEIPFRFPTLTNSRFGVMVRNDRGEAQPLLFAPVLGQDESRMQEGSTYRFAFRLIARKDDIYSTYKYIATHVMGFHDYRQNAACSLNQTLENMIAYAMNDFYSGWNADLKAPDYSTDVPGTVKLVSALHPLSIALVTDNKQIYTRRALPMIEYLMSREKYLYSENTEIKGQDPSHFLRGPAANVSELASLYEISQKRSSVFRHYALELYDKPRVLNLKMVSAGNSWQNSMALYRMTGDKQYLKKAEDGADAYISLRLGKPQEDFSDVHIADGGQFWTDFSPKWIDLLELYKASGEKRYLEAARKGAEEFVEYIWMEPAPPSHEIMINKDGEVGEYAYQNRLHPHVESMRGPEQEVPAWRVAQTGLISEASTTYVANRAVFLDHYAAYLLKLSYYTGDTFFRNIARSAIVGRYANFPGYSIMGEYTNIYSRPDYPLRSLSELTYNNIYYNHIWPQIALLMDYLVSDAYVASSGKVDFPSRYAEGYAYLQSEVYGDRKGTFYGDKNVELWMPAHLLTTNDIHANYIAGYGSNKLYICLLNQSDSAADVTLQLNPDLVPFSENKRYPVRVWQDNQPAPMQMLSKGMTPLHLSPKGITGICIEGISVMPQFQKEILDAGDTTAMPGVSEKDGPYGKTVSMIINMGPTLKEAYIYLQATEKELKEVILSYKSGDRWISIRDSVYPFEFSVPLGKDQNDIRYKIESVAF